MGYGIGYRERYTATRSDASISQRWTRFAERWTLRSAI